ncbi:hypothetical protein CC1G_04194 [Coprinopsis cinerea okayama7|uniref:Uncharacterized protein n=1 Tax=Coprinopsis cinerea (strain Okayama-7 / 130 / ATCC MYA-4618 / FGSC 9003) TaxID=240176 RepID=A8NF72_COPC7|nr:hypothetical protein CC1G_04194 [Coprinopsis cinerea okayama7\|eukprot:XP_001833215.1 hypothetical protein CC1G_04194 [Coprinopsis cinerea okayama7\
MLLSPASSNHGGLPPQGSSFWGKFKPKPKEPELPPAAMAVARTKLLTLVFADMETIRVLPNSFVELEALARDWTKPPPDAMFTLRVPVEFVSFQAARLVTGPYIYLTGEESYQIATMGVQGLRVEIVSDGPPPPDEPPPPPPPPVLEMPASFNLELTPGQMVALDVTVNSDELDMARMEDGTTVDGMFWGKLDIVHQGDTHKMEFSGARLPPNDDVLTPEFMVDTRILRKLPIACKPSTAKCNLILLAPAVQYCEVTLSFSPLWKIGITWPPAEPIAENKVKYFLRVNPGGALEHFEQEIVTTALYYEAIPNPEMVDPHEFIAPRNGFAMSFKDFIPHLNNVLDQLGMSLHARTNFVNNNMSAFASHKNIAYRFLGPSKIAAAIDITVTSDPCVFTRIFLIFRGVSDDEMSNFDTAGEKEANSYNWRETIGWSEDSKDTTVFRVLETTVLEVS